VRHERQDEQYAEAIAELTGPTGPLRFARVGAGLFRGGQPSHRHLALLHAIGVRTIVCLRREAAPAWRAEAAEAKRLGMRFLHFPWYGIFGARDALIDGVVAAMRDWSTGAVYVHCKRGRDRTSVVVARYRVLVEGWAPELAWQREVLDYGWKSICVYRKLRAVFDRIVRSRVAGVGAAPALSPSR
jgi:protein tyrosine/serine phosphatase